MKNYTQTQFFTILLFIFATQTISAQVKDMLDLNDAQTKLTTKYNRTSVPSNAELDDGFDSKNDPVCARLAFNYAITHIESMRLKNGIKQSAATTISIFGSTLSKLGFGYAVDAVKILTLLDEVQEAGGDSDDFAKAIAKYAFDKGSGKLLKTAKEKYPSLLDGDELSSEALSKLADLAKSESNKFFNKFIDPPKTELFKEESNSNGCYEYYFGEISANADKAGNEIIKDHTGPILILKVGVFCGKCPKNKTKALKEAYVRFDIPLDLIKNPKAVPLANKKERALKSFFGKLPPDYIYKPNLDKVKTKIGADCCSPGDEDASFIEPESETVFLIGTGTGIGFDTDEEFKGFNFSPGAVGQFNFGNANAVGVGFRGIVGGSGDGNFKQRNNGFAFDMYYQKNFPNVFKTEIISPSFRVSIPIQKTNRKFKNAGGAWQKNGNTISTGVGISPGLTFNKNRFSTNLIFNLLSLNLNKTRSQGGSYGPFNKRFNFGINNQAASIEILYKL